MNTNGAIDMSRSNKVKAAIASSLALVILGGISVSVFAPSVKADGFDGDFDKNPENYSVWDGSTYDFSWYEAGKESKNYTISTASQFAALSIVSNDISGEEYANIRANIQDEQYISLMEDFSDATITLESDIDLGGYDILPICYPWRTSNLSTTYEIHRPDGTTTHYNALSEVPDITPVDPWVGDENGNMISTRYWEFPESEMRFRDLLYAVNFDGEVNQRYNTMAKFTDAFMFTPSDRWIGQTEHHNQPLAVEGWLNYLGYYHGGMPIAYNYFSPHLDFNDILVNEIRTLDEDSMIASYSYKDIKEYTERIGFEGVFDGDGHRIKNAAPYTPWTEDPMKRLTTYDPISKGLFGMIAEDGEVKNLNVSGSYDADDVVSYSGILCGYNYGLIENCWVDGSMEQGLVTQIYPTRREYAPNKNSTYVLSDNPGTVLPVGHSGFVTAVNNGNIKNCTTSGSVNQAYRMFGFAACTNNGSIDGFTNKASFSTYEIMTDFTTDEWGYDFSDTAGNNFTIDELENTDSFKYLAANVEKGTIAEYYASHTGVNQYTAAFDSSFFNMLEDEDEFKGQVAAATNGSIIGQSDTGAPWIPGLYKTDNYKSVAANHIYGVYGYTAVGGICAENNGRIINVINDGEIEVMYNSSSRRITHMYDKTAENETKQDYYSYIRPSGSFGVFSTQNNTINLAAGITTYNTGTLENITNNGEIKDRNITDRDSVVKKGLNFIAYTGNGFYRNDCVVYENKDATELIYYPFGYRWWVNAENSEEASEPKDTVYQSSSTFYTTGHSELLKYDENMPYPISLNTSDGMCQFTSNITVWNIGNIDTAQINAKAQAAITVSSDGRSVGSSISNAVIKDCTYNYNVAHIMTNTSLSNIEVLTQSVNNNALATKCVSKLVPITITDITTADGDNLFDVAIGDNEGDISLDRITMYDRGSAIEYVINEPTNVDFKNVYNFNDSHSGISSKLVNCNLENVYVYGTATECGIGRGTIASFMNNVNYYGKSNEDNIIDYAIGEFSGGEYNGVHTAVFADADNLGWAKHIIKVDGATMRDVTSFVNVEDTAMDISHVNASDVSIVGRTKAKTIPKNEYWYLVSLSNCERMLLQLDVDFEWVNPFENFSVQMIPGVLKVYNDSNKFEDVAVATPNGMVSYSSVNIMLEDDNSIRTDAVLSYDKNSWKSGALAYYLDNGDSEDRTYDYTVAKNDVKDILSDISNIVDMSRVNLTDRYLNYPEYTRKIVNDSEKPYYRFSIPFTSNGAGELIASLQRDDETYATKAQDEIFPITEIYAQEGELVSLEKVENTGYAMTGIMRTTRSQGTIEIESDGSHLDAYIHSSETMPAEDVTLVTTWSDVHTVEIEPNEYVQIVPNCTNAATGRRIYVNTFMSSDEVVIDKVYYYNYKRDLSNRLVLDFENPVEITDMYFEMPNNNVRIFVTTLGNEAHVDRFILANTRGVIDHTNHIITVNLDASADLTSIAPDNFTVTGNAVISPDPTEPQDFTKPVEYTLTTESGKQIIYTVKVTPREDGMITYFEVAGKEATIDQNTGLITLRIPSDLNLSNVTPYIVWSGSNITPSGCIDLTNEFKYTVTASSGEDKVYTVQLTTVNVTEGLKGFNIDIPGLDNVVWTLDERLRTISTTVPYGTDISHCVLTKLDWDGVVSSHAIGDIINLTKAQYLTIKTDTDNTITYSIVVKEDPSTAKTINQFVLFGYEGVISGTDIEISLPNKYDITNIMPDVVNFTGKTIIEDIYIRRDFTLPITFTVEAYDGTKNVYTVHVAQI